jgi:hypothetical protein
MKGLFLQVVFIVTTLFSQAQNYTISRGEPDSLLKEFVTTTVLGQVGDKYLLLASNKNTLYVTNKKTLWSTFNRNSVLYYDTNSLNSVKYLNFPKFDGALDNSESNNNSIDWANVVDIKLSGDTLTLITSTIDYKNRRAVFHCWQLEALTLKPLTPRARLISQIEVSPSSIHEYSTFNESTSLNGYTMVHFISSYKTDEYIIHVLTYDKQMNELENKTYTLKNNHFNDTGHEIFISPTGDVYIVFLVATEPIPLWSDPRWMRIVKLSDNEEKLMISNVKLENGDIINGKLLFNQNGEVFITGYYSHLSSSKSEGLNVFGGAYLGEIDAETGEVLSVEKMELTANQKQALCYQPPMSDRVPVMNYNQLSMLKLSSVNLDSSGDIIMIGVASLTLADNAIVNSRFGFPKPLGSLVISKISLKGEGFTNTIVPRNSTGTKNIDPIICQVGDDVHVLFNDSHPNIERLALLASGVTPTEVSKSGKYDKLDKTAYMPIVNHSMTDADAPIDLFEWNNKGTSIRHTTINAKGNWSVNALNYVLDPKLEMPVSSDLGEFKLIEPEKRYIICVDADRTLLRFELK